MGDLRQSLLGTLGGVGQGLDSAFGQAQSGRQGLMSRQARQAQQAQLQQQAGIIPPDSLILDEMLRARNEIFWPRKRKKTLRAELQEETDEYLKDALSLDIDDITDSASVTTGYLQVDGRDRSKHLYVGTDMALKTPKQFFIRDITA